MDRRVTQGAVSEEIRASSDCSRYCYINSQQATLKKADYA